MDIRKVKKLIELLEESGIAEIEISEGDDSVRISRFPQPGMYAAPPMMAAPAPMPATTPVAPEETPNTPAPEALPSAGETVVAPMVGTFYSSPAPGARAFVEIGSEVQVGDTLCIIEAMKMMNQIEAEIAGKITAVLASNGEPVEFGQSLFTVE